MRDILTQIGLACAYYAGLILIIRLAGKRLAGQVATFDLIVLISLAVVLQTIALRPGRDNAVTFIVTVFLAHLLLARLCARSTRIRRWMRGAARPLVSDGRVSYEALEDEALSYEELLAGLRKLGHEGPERVRLATLEETGHISVVAMEDPGAPPQGTPPAAASSRSGERPG